LTLFRLFEVREFRKLVTFFVGLKARVGDPFIRTSRSTRSAEPVSVTFTTLASILYPIFWAFFSVLPKTES
jgi:hypothetical protein